MSHPMWFGLPIKPLMVTTNNKHELRKPAFAKAAECLHLLGTSDYSPRTIVTIGLCQWSCQDTAVILSVPWCLPGMGQEWPGTSHRAPVYLREEQARPLTTAWPCCR